MEEKFLQALSACRQKALTLGVRIRPMDKMADVHRCLTGHRESDGFYQLADLGKLNLSLEALAVQKPYTGLISDEEANTALMRLLDAGYNFTK